MSNLDYEDDIEIDEQSLDVEWLQQAKLFMRYAKYAAETRYAMDLAKEALDVVKATLDQEIRSHPDAYEIAKITEAVVQNAIITHPEHQAEMKKFVAAKYEAELAQAAVRAFDQRKVALENLVRLHGMSYFSGPAVPRNLTEEREARQKRSNQKVTMRRR